MADVDPAVYGLLGGGLRLAGPKGAFEVRAQAGRGAESGSGSWAEGTVGAELAGSSGRLLASLRGEAFGLRNSDASSIQSGEGSTYTAFGGALRPGLGLFFPGVSLQLRGDLTRGSATTRERSRAPGGGLPVFGGGRSPVGGSEARHTLALTGAALELTSTVGPGASVQLTGERYQATNRAGEGAYQGLSATLGLSGRVVEAAFGGRWWQSPVGDGFRRSEFGYSAAVAVNAAPGVTTRLTVGRSVDDPLYGTRGSLSASVGLTFRLGSAAARPRPPVAEVGAWEGRGRTVRFRLRANQARAVALAGDFTRWEKRPMRRDGDYWTVDVVLVPGTYHFAFVVDGETWTVPDHAPGVVDDGFGRKNASIVIPGA